MSLQRSLVVYVVFLHLLFMVVGAVLLIRTTLWLLAWELVVVASALWGIALIRTVSGSGAAVDTGVQLLKESDFQSRLRETGREETDRLVRVYNRMADHLREERVRLQEQQHLLSTILEVSPSGILILDFDGRVNFANAASRLLLASRVDRDGARGTAPDAILGKPLTQLEPPFGSALVDIRAGGSRIVTLAGGRRVRCHRGSFIDRGFERGFVLLEELTEELRQHERAAYEKVIRMLSHEVNNSMAAAHSLLQSCLHYAAQIHEADRGDFETALRVVSTRTQDLSAFMRGFADVVRLPPPRLQPHDIRALLESVAVLLRADSDKRRIGWRWDVQEELPPIALDRAQIEQVFVNVCKNALEAIGSDGTVTVRMGRDKGRAFVAIEDTGPGVPADVRAQLVTPFFSTKDQGQGIGLTVVREILAQHGFEYALDSAPSTPTRFTVFLTV